MRRIHTLALATLVAGFTAGNLMADPPPSDLHLGYCVCPLHIESSLLLANFDLPPPGESVVLAVNSTATLREFDMFDLTKTRFFSEGRWKNGYLVQLNPIESNTNRRNTVLLWHQKGHDSLRAVTLHAPVAVDETRLRCDERGALIGSESRYPLLC